MERKVIIDVHRRREAGKERREEERERKNSDESRRWIIKRRIDKTRKHADSEEVEAGRGKETRKERTLSNVSNAAQVSSNTC